MEQTVRAICRECERHGISKIIGDNYLGAILQELFRKESGSSVQLVNFPLTNPRKALAVQVVRALMRENKLCIAPDEIARKQLSEYSERISHTGTIGFEGKGKHDDRASVLIMLGLAYAERLVPDSEVFFQCTRTVLQTSWDDSGGARIEKQLSP